MSNNSNHITIHDMQWLRLRLFILSSEEGTVSLEIYKEPQGYHKIVAYICNLWVKEDYRRKGHATALMDKAEAIAKKHGHTSVFLQWTKGEATEATLKWYERRGYKEVAFGNNGCSLMMKEL